jgi:hypothetical protein
MGGSLNNFKYRKTLGSALAAIISSIAVAHLFLAVTVTQTVVFFGIHGAGHFIG